MTNVHRVYMYIYNTKSILEMLYGTTPIQYTVESGNIEFCLLSFDKNDRTTRDSPHPKYVRVVQVYWKIVIIGVPTYNFFSSWC